MRDLNTQSKWYSMYSIFNIHIQYSVWIVIRPPTSTFEQFEHPYPRPLRPLLLIPYHPMEKEKQAIRQCAKATQTRRQHIYGKVALTLGHGEGVFFAKVSRIEPCVLHLFTSLEEERAEA